jgi:GT2 family glycosyltransferase
MDTMSTKGIREELRLPKQLLEDALGQSVPLFAYPHGYSGPRVRRLTKEAGYTAAAGVRHMLSRPDDDRFAVSRLLVQDTTTAEEFSAWLQGRGARKQRRGDSMATRGWRTYRRGKAILQGRPVSVFPLPPAEETGFQPRRVLSVDLATQQVEYPDPTHRPDHPRARVLVNWRDQPIGMLEVEADDTDVVRVVTEEAWQSLRPQLNAVMRRSGLAEPASTADLAVVGEAAAEAAASRSLVSVAIPSFRNAESTVQTVRRLLQSTWQPLEVIVADNDADPGPLAAALEAAFAGDDRVRWVHEPRQGISYARNAGLAAARGDIVAFTDDDVLVDRHWVERLVEAFDAADGVVCVTGAILPAELETHPQLWLEEYGGFHKGFERQIFNLTTHRRDMPLYPYNAGLFGAGANMAFRADVLRSLGGFAPELGTGTVAHGGEELELFVRTINAGHTLVYEPAALLWHHHRRSLEAIRRQMFRYGIGLSATVTKWMLGDRRTALDVARRLPTGVVYVLSPGSKKNANKSADFPRMLTMLELCGILVGPVAYVRSRRRDREKAVASPVAAGVTE